MTTTTKQLALDHINRINAGDIAGASALMAEDCHNHAALPEAQGRQGFASVIEKVRTAYPDMKYTVEDVVAEGDRAVLRLTFVGTNTGPLTFVRMPMKATGKSVKFEQIHIVRASGGKIVEHWMASDMLAMFRQLGVQMTPPS
jgi:steroid delta-isomerase-like uncharacterized protein